MLSILWTGDTMTTKNAALQQWINEVASMTKPDKIYWCDGSKKEYKVLVEQLLATGELLELNKATYPNCYLHRSDPSDVARVEHLTYVCTENRRDAGPNNNWMEPSMAHQKLNQLQ